MNRANASALETEGARDLAGRRGPMALYEARQAFLGRHAAQFLQPGEAGAVHDAPRIGVRDDPVHQAFVVPDDEVADLSLVAIDAVWLRGPLLQHLRAQVDQRRPLSSGAIWLSSTRAAGSSPVSGRYSASRSPGSATTSGIERTAPNSVTCKKAADSVPVSPQPIAYSSRSCGRCDLQSR